MTDPIADIFLGFSHLTTIFLLLISGFLLMNRVVFFQAMILSVFDIVVNVALKGTFKVPLSLSLHKTGYAFPSGHMQLSTVLYVWLLLCIVSWPWRAFVVIILFGIAQGLIYYDYHNISDVCAGLLCGLCLVGLFKYGLLKYGKILPWILLVLSSCLMGYNAFLYMSIPPHAIVSYGVLVGLIMIERFFSRNECHQKYWKFTRIVSQK